MRTGISWALFVWAATLIPAEALAGRYGELASRPPRITSPGGAGGLGGARQYSRLNGSSTRIINHRPTPSGQIRQGIATARSGGRAIVNSVKGVRKLVGYKVAGDRWQAQSTRQAMRDGVAKGRAQLRGGARSVATGVKRTFTEPVRRVAKAVQQRVSTMRQNARETRREIKKGLGATRRGLGYAIAGDRRRGVAARTERKQSFGAAKQRIRGALASVGAGLKRVVTGAPKQPRHPLRRTVVRKSERTRRWVGKSGGRESRIKHEPTWARLAQNT